MKFTYEDLAKAMGLKVGDRIKCEDYLYTIGNEFYLFNEKAKNEVPLTWLINNEFEILPPKKKVGELLCHNIYCKNCPLNILDCSDDSDLTLYEQLEITNDEYNDQEIYDIIKKRLDKEVEEDE